MSDPHALMALGAVVRPGAWDMLNALPPVTRGTSEAGSVAYGLGLVDKLKNLPVPPSATDTNEIS